MCATAWDSAVIDRNKTQFCIARALGMLIIDYIVDTFLQALTSEATEHQTLGKKNDVSKITYTNPDNQQVSDCQLSPMCFYTNLKLFLICAHF